MGRDLATFKVVLRTTTTNLSMLEFQYDKNLLQSDATYLRDVYTPNKEKLLRQVDALLDGPRSTDKDAILDWIAANADAIAFLSRTSVWDAVKNDEIFGRRKNANAVLGWVNDWIDLYKNKADVLLQPEGSPKDLTNAAPGSDEARQRDRRERLNSTLPGRAQPQREAPQQQDAPQQGTKQKKATKTLGQKLTDILNSLTESDPAKDKENLRYIEEYISTTNDPNHPGLGEEFGMNLGLYTLDIIEAIANKYPNNGEMLIRCAATASNLSKKCQNDPDYKKNAIEKDEYGKSRVNELRLKAKPFSHHNANPLIRNEEEYKRRFSMMFGRSSEDPTPVKEECSQYLKTGIKNATDPFFALYAIKTIGERYPDDNRIAVDCMNAAADLKNAYYNAPDTLKEKAELKAFLDSKAGMSLARSIDKKGKVGMLPAIVSSVNDRFDEINREMQAEMEEFQRYAARLEKVSRHDSDEYKEIIRVLKAVAKPFNPLKDDNKAALKYNDMTNAQIKAGKYAFVHAKISEYLDHKARRGVNRNAFEKLAAVEELNQFVCEKIQNNYRVPVTLNFTDKLGTTKDYHYPDDCFKTYHDELTAGKKDNKLLVNTETSFDEIAGDVAATGKSFAYSQVQKIQKVAQCMDRIMLRVQNNLRDEIRNETHYVEDVGFRTRYVKAKYLKEFVDVKKSFSTDPTMSPQKRPGGRLR